MRKLYAPEASVRHWLKAGLGWQSSAAASPGLRPALDDVSVQIPRGEAFGIIGRNGAGKSTLLQILAGTLRASSGSCEVRGRVTALLELGSGFNPDFTGRENIFLAGAILGFSREEMTRRFDEIAAFADIGAYLEQPVKTYSTGMLMRVAFAVAISVEPEVLIVDEALSVGDILFQQKCSRRLRELVDAGVTLLVVTHDVAFVLSMCQRAMWLDQGRVRFLGEAGACVREYVAAMAAISGNVSAPADAYEGLARIALPAAPSLPLEGRQRLGNGGVRIERAWVLHNDSSASTTFHLGDWAVLVLAISAQTAVKGVSGGCELRNRHGQVVFATGLRVVRRLVSHLAAGEQCVVTIRFKLELQPGQYTLDIGCGAGSDADNTWDRVLNAAVIEVSSTPEHEVVHGLVRLPCEIATARPRD